MIQDQGTHLVELQHGLVSNRDLLNLAERENPLSSGRWDKSLPAPPHWLGKPRVISRALSWCCTQQKLCEIPP